MGGGSWTDHDWKTFSTTKVTGKSAAGIYTARTMDPMLDPKNAVRESRDSADNPNSTAIILGLDVTGSMDSVLEATMKGLNTLVTEIYNRNPVPNPQIMGAGIGDVQAGDDFPLQITQFESDIRIADQLSKIYLERGGGGNNYESYALLQYFAATRTSIDCFEKRGKKGYLFTIGDEEPTPYLRKQDIEQVLGDTPQSDIQAAEILEMALRTYNVFHVIIEQGSHYRYAGKQVTNKWEALLGKQRVISLSDHTKLAEVVVSTLQVCNGADIDTVTKSWDGSTALVVSKAIKDLTAEGKVGSGSDVVIF